MLVCYEVTQACDLACRNDRASAQTVPHPAELTADESLRLVDQLVEFPTLPMLVLTGGDPMKRADIFDLIEYGTQSGLDVSMDLNPTLLVDAQAIRRLGQAGVSRVAVNIDGSDAAIHDAMRGVAGSFARSLRILGDAREEGISTQVNTTLVPSNLDQLDRMAELLASHRIDTWSVSFMVPVGDAADLPRLSAEQCEVAFEKLWRQTQRQPFAIRTTAAPHYRRYAIMHQLPSTQIGRHSAMPRGYIPLNRNDGKGMMFVSHAGLIHPSGDLPIVCGMFPQQHVVRIYQDSPVFCALRDADRLEGKCRVCEFRHICGGSRARAYAVTGNLFAQEPDCSYVPAAMS